MYVPCVHALGRESFTHRVRQAECSGLLVVPREDDFDDNINSRTMQEKTCCGFAGFQNELILRTRMCGPEVHKTKLLVYKRASMKLRIAPKADEGNM